MFAFSTPLQLLQPCFKSPRLHSTNSISTSRAQPRACLLGDDVLTRASRLGAGTWGWGNQILYQYDPSRDEELQAAFNAAVLRGITLFDTGDSYGTLFLNARAEVLLGKFIRESPVPSDNLVIATKCASYPWRITRRSIRDAVARSAERLGRPVDLAQIHWSVKNYAPWQERVLWDGFGDALEDNNCKSIGVSNFGPSQLAACSDYLTKERGIKLCSAQVQLSLLSRSPLYSGLLKVGEDRNIAIIGYSPLCLGLLAGTTEKKNRGIIRNNLFDGRLGGAIPLQNELSIIAGELGTNVSQAQVAIAWALSKNVFVLSGVTREKHALEAAECESISNRLTQDQIRRLEEASDACPQQMVENIFQTN